MVNFKVILWDSDHESNSITSWKGDTFWSWADGFLSRTGHSHFSELVVLGSSWLHLAEESWLNLSELLIKQSNFRGADNLSAFFLANLDQEWSVH